MTQSPHCCGGGDRGGGSGNVGRNLRGVFIQFSWAALLMIVLRGGSSLSRASSVACEPVWWHGSAGAGHGRWGSGLVLYLQAPLV